MTYPSHHPLAGRVALVTGASRGIGRATAEAMSQAGASIAVHYFRQADGAKTLVGEVASNGGKAKAYQADLNDPKEIDGLMAAVKEDFASIHILVNNAGVLRVTNTESTTEEDWDEMLRVNLKAAFLCVQGVLPLMKESGGGAIVNVASIAGVNGGNMGPAYAAAKGGLIALTRYLARDCIKFGVRVNCVAPTLTDTDLLREPGVDVMVDRILKMNPMGRLASPVEVARVIRFLASDEASFINGDCVLVTGGP